MRLNRLPLLAGLTLTLVLNGSPARLNGFAAELPTRLSDQEFWKLTADLSEPNGSFRSENLLSNEMVLAGLLPEVVAKTKPGGVYIGVGPEQNFSYLAAMKPRMAFITDIRRGNLHVLLMYKALFELSADRAEFVSRLFTRPRPATLTASSTVREIMDAYWDIRTGDEAAFARNLQAIQQHLTKTRALPLPADDLEGIESAYRAFYFYGPAMNYAARTTLMPIGNSRNAATYWDLMTQTDASGKALSYLASEESFRFIKDMYNRNMIVPLVGNFSGPKTIRAIGTWVRAQGATVRAFYVSTVEHYLRDAGTMGDFCANVATLPTDASSVFIRPGNMQQLSQGNAMGPAGAGARINIPVGTPAIGTYQIGVVVPVGGGCG